MSSLWRGTYWRTSDDTQDLEEPQIDWSAPYVDSDANIQEIEPPAPPARAIHPLVTQPGWRVTVTPYNSVWREQFQTIQAQLQHILGSARPPVKYTTIEHIGSTAIPGLSAKPNIDIMITLPNKDALDTAVEAFEWQIPDRAPFVRYTRIRDGGGIKGRESFKLYVPDSSPYNHTTPERSVYLINEHESNVAGCIQIRCYRSVRDTLCDPANRDLLDEYGKVKTILATQTFPDSTTYSRMKDGIVRQILLRAGWTDVEVDEKDSLMQIEERPVELPY